MNMLFPEQENYELFSFCILNSQFWIYPTVPLAGDCRYDGDDYAFGSIPTAVPVVNTRKVLGFCQGQYQGAGQKVLIFEKLLLCGKKTYSPYI
jgi:hypothetical protein